MIIDGIDLPFTYVCGSKEWPSTDPKDSPFSKYVCDLCRGEIVFKEFGSFSIGEQQKIQGYVIDRVKWHYNNCPKRYKKLV